MMMMRAVGVLTLAGAATGFAPAARRAAPRAVAVDFAVDPALALGAVAAGGAAVAVLAPPTAVDDKAEVEQYFNGVGFGRWNKIYSETEEVNKVQMDIRVGHQETIDRILSWAKDEKLTTVCDLGCGVGSLAIPLAQQGAKVFASDISAAMVEEASERAAAEGVKAASFEVADMESVQGTYGTVTCVDVMIHYPKEKMADMVTHLAALAEDRIYVSFAPKTLQYSLLKKIGSLFPGPSKATRAYLHSEADVAAALGKAGFEVKQRHLTARNFYFSLLLEAVPKAA